MTILSIFAGGLWIIPLLTFIGAIIFFWMGRYKSNKFYIFSGALAVATVAIILLMAADR